MNEKQRELIQQEIMQHMKKRRKVMYFQIAVVSIVVSALLTYYIFNIL